MSLISEFKEFINRGNVMDMAVGVIIGGAFTSIVTSLTNDIINPLIKLVSGGGTEISGLTIPVPGTERGIDFSSFISAIINFLIVAVVVFLIVKAFNKAQNLGSGLTKGLTSKVLGKDGEEIEVEMLPRPARSASRRSRRARRAARIAPPSFPSRLRASPSGSAPSGIAARAAAQRCLRSRT